MPWPPISPPTPTRPTRSVIGRAVLVASQVLACSIPSQVPGPATSGAGDHGRGHARDPGEDHPAIAPGEQQGGEAQAEVRLGQAGGQPEHGRPGRQPAPPPARVGDGETEREHAVPLAEEQGLPGPQPRQRQPAAGDPHRPRGRRGPGGGAHHQDGGAGEQEELEQARTR